MLSAVSFCDVFMLRCDVRVIGFMVGMGCCVYVCVCWGGRIYVHCRVCDPCWN